jgi:hypothetical protein
MIRISIAPKVAPLPLPSVQWYRKPHDLEVLSYNEPENWDYGGDGYRAGPVRNAVVNDPRNPNQKPMPEVYRVFPGHQTSLSCAAVKLIRDINHPMIPVKQISSMLNSNYAFSNNTGFPDRYNCLTGENAGEKDPALHEPVITGGALFRALKVENGLVYFESILTTRALPAAKDVIERGLWFWVTAVTKDGQVNIAAKLGADGIYYPVRMPLFSRMPLYAPARWLHKLPAGFSPVGYDPRKMW